MGGVTHTDVVGSVAPYALTVVPQLYALGAASGLRDAQVDAWVGWPDRVVSAEGRELVALAVQVGYDERGTHIAYSASIDAAACGLDADAAARAVERGVGSVRAAWLERLAAGAGVPGPFAPVMGAYYDVVAGMGGAAKVVYPNGAVATAGTLAGVDAWGRAVVTTDAGELSVAPEQARVVPAGWE